MQSAVLARMLASAQQFGRFQSVRERAAQRSCPGSIVLHEMCHARNRAGAPDSWWNADGRPEPCNKGTTLELAQEGNITMAQTIPPLQTGRSRSHSTKQRAREGQLAVGWRRPG